MQNDRQYQCVQLALSLMSKTTHTYNYVAPVRNRSSNHWQLVEVMLPKRGNRLTTIIDFCPQPISEISPEYHVTMWYAKLFGMFINRNRVINNLKLLSYVGDMDPSGFDMEDNKNSNVKDFFTTLDHQPGRDNNSKKHVKKPYPLSSIHHNVYDGSSSR